MKHMMKMNKYSARIGWLGVLGAIIFFCGSAVEQAEAAALVVSPPTGVYTAGDTFAVNVVVNTSGASINAAEGTLSFNPNELSVVAVQKGSIFNLWTADPVFSNTAGTITFSGGSPSGYSGANGTILVVTFRTKGAGSAKVSFKSGSVLAADGRGTNVLQNMNGGSFTIAARSAQPAPEVIEYVAPANTPALPVIVSATHPDAPGWSAKTTAELTWSVPSGVTAVRTLLNNSPGSIPTKVYSPAISSLTIEDLEEGVSYVHVQFQNSDGWGKVAHYRLAVDTQKPDTFTIALAENADLSNPEQVLQLKTEEDSGSPVKRFVVQVDGGEPYEYINDSSGSSTLTLPPLEPGRHTVIIEAFDAAQNSFISTFSFGIQAFDRPQFTEYPTEMSEGVIPVLRGITRPDALLTITLTRLGAGSTEVSAVQTYEVQSDETGVFTFIPEGSLLTGSYELVAVATDQYGAKSEASDVIRIAVQKPGYIAIGTLLISALSVIVPLVALLILLVLAIVYGWNRIRRTQMAVRTETSEALTIIEREFNKLEALLDAEGIALADTRRTKKLTKAEMSLLETVQSALTRSRTVIRKEVDDVDDTV